MNKHIFGLFLIIYGCFKIVVSVLNEIAPDNLRNYLRHIPVLGHIFEENDTTIARQVFNLCFLLYGLDSFMHGLYLNRIWITTQPWILSHTGSYIFHAILGVFMFVLFYKLIDVNHSFYIVEGVYAGLTMLAMVPIMYIYNTRNTISKVSPIIVMSILSIGILMLVGHSIMIAYPNRVPNVIDMIAIPLNSL